MPRSHFTPILDEKYVIFHLFSFQNRCSTASMVVIQNYFGLLAWPTPAAGSHACSAALYANAWGSMKAFCISSKVSSAWEASATASRAV